MSKLKLKPSKKLVGKTRKFTIRLGVVATDAAGGRVRRSRAIKAASSGIRGSPL